MVGFFLALSKHFDVDAITCSLLVLVGVEVEDCEQKDECAQAYQALRDQPHQQTEFRHLFVRVSDPLWLRKVIKAVFIIEK